MTDKAMHSPGPWRAEVNEDDRVFAGHVIYLGDAIDPSNYDSHLVVEYDHGLRPGDGAQFDEADANARLIAAAPDLLAACKAMLTKHDEAMGAAARLMGARVGSSTVSERLRAAIAKAEG